jgi:hypothetical protein
VFAGNTGSVELTKGLFLGTVISSQQTDEPSILWAAYCNGSCLLLLVQGSPPLELRAPTGGTALQAKTFTVERVLDPKHVEGTRRVSPAVHICASKNAVFPLLLRMEHVASSDNLEHLSFWRAADPDQPFEELKGGVFSDEGWAHIEVQHFSVYAY